MRRLTWLLLALTSAALAVGCGSSSSSGGSTATTSSTAATSPTSTASGPGASTSSGAGTGSTSTSASGSGGDAVARLLVSSCKSRIQNEPALTTSAKSKLEPLCDRAGSGPAAAREVAREVCIEIVKRSALPGTPMTPARKRALAACKSAK